MSDFDPVEFGKMIEAVNNLKAETAELRDELANARKSIDDLVALANQGRGAWRMLLGQYSIAAAIGAGVVWLINHWPFK